MKFKLLAVCLGLTVAVESVIADDGFNTAALAQQTLKQLPGCLDYKIHGISFRLILKPWPHVVKTLNVSHNSPELITQTHIDLDNMPWKEVNAVFGIPYKEVSGGIFKTSMSIISPETGAIPMSSGKYQYGQFGHHQAGQQYEVSIFGNPLALILSGINWNGYQLPNIPTSSNSPSGLDFFEKWMSGKIFSIPANLVSSVGFDRVIRIMRSQQTIKFLDKFVGNITRVAERFGVKLGRSPMCPSQSQPMMPYYLSGIDSILWRTGYPIADIEHSLTILNPLSDDKVGGTFTDPLFKASLPETWGNIYPRWGTVNLTDDAKASAVIAIRGLSILKDSPKSLGRIYHSTQFDINNDAWAKVYPESSKCHIRIENTSVTREQSKRYAWNNWMNHRCDLYRRGTKIAFIPIGPIQVTSKVPD